MAMVAQALEASASVEHILCVTAQHREMLDPILRLFDLRPDYDLDIMSHGQQLTDVTNGVLEGMRSVLRRGPAGPRAGPGRYDYGLGNSLGGILRARAGRPCRGWAKDRRHGRTVA